MATRIALLILALAPLGCDLDGGRAGPSACFSDLECPIGFSCHPWQQVCIQNRPPADIRVTDAGVDVAAPPACAAGTPCDDGDPCTRTDRCDEAGECVGTAFSCDDGFECTLDQCDGAGGCDYTIAAGQCFINGACFEAGDESPANPCQTCIPSASAATWTHDDTRTCDDGDACTGDDTCAGGACQSGPAVTCDDQVECTADSCDPEAGCLHDDTACPTDGE